MSADIKYQAQTLRDTLLQTNHSDTVTLLAGSLGVYQNLNQLDNGTKALILLAAFIAKYGEVLDQQLTAHEELHRV